MVSKSNWKWGIRMSKTYIGTLYTGVSEDFQRGIYPIARCLKAEQHDLSVVEE